MKSSLVALVVCVLGLSTTALADDQCTAKCELVKNGTVEWENGVIINFNADVKIILSKVEKVFVIINQKSQLLIAFDLSGSKLVLIYRLQAEFGIVIDLTTGKSVKAVLDINLVRSGDYSTLKTAFAKANNDILSGTSSVFTINLTFVGNAVFNIDDVLTSGSDTTKAEIKVSYLVVFKGFFDVCKDVSTTYTFVQVTIIAGFGTTNELITGVASSFNAVIISEGKLTISFGVFIVESLQSNSVTVFIKFEAALDATAGNVDQAITEIKNGVSIDKSITVGTYRFRFIVALVKEYLRFAISFGKINIDISYAGKALAVWNSNANVYYVVFGQYTFIYSVQAKGGFLFSSSNLVYITGTDINAKEINTATLAVYISANAATVFNSKTKITLKNFRTALESVTAFTTFCKNNNIANADSLFKVFKSYANSITGLISYSLNFSISLKVTFSITAHYEVDTTIFNNLIVGTLCTGLAVVTSFASSATLYASIKLVLG